MNIKNSKKIVPATVFAAIIVLLAFAVMSTTVSARVYTTLDPVSGDLGDVVKVTIGDVTVGADQTVNVADTLPAEFSYIRGTFTVNDNAVNPDVNEQVISYNINIIDNIDKYTIKFNVKVTKAYSEDVTVTNTVEGTWYDATNNVIKRETATAPFDIWACELVTGLNLREGNLGDEVKVKIGGTVEAGLAVNVVDTLPAELTYIGNFKVKVENVQEAVPTVDKQVISYIIDNTAGTSAVSYGIAFDVKVTEASWKNEIVTNTVVETWYDEDDLFIMTEEATADFTILPFEELWKKADGLTELTIYEKTETQWELVISVTNPFNYIMENTVITDRFGAEIEIDDADTSTTKIDEVSITPGTSWDYTTKGKSEKVFLTWEIGDLRSGETAELILLVSTDHNPGKNDKYPDGHQEYSSPSPLDDPYEMNSGATLKFFDKDSMQLSAVTDSIYVTVLPEE